VQAFASQDLGQMIDRIFSSRRIIISQKCDLILTSRHDIPPCTQNPATDGRSRSQLLSTPFGFSLRAMAGSICQELFWPGLERWDRLWVRFHAGLNVVGRGLDLPDLECPLDAGR